MNATYKTRTRQGSAFVTVMIVMGVVGLAVIPMVWIALQQPQGVRHSCNRLRARAIAEAGIGVAFQKLSTNWSLCNDASAFPLTSYGNGSYTTTITPINATALVVRCDGTYQEAQVPVVVDMKNYVTNMPTGGNPGATGAYLYALASGSLVDTGNSNAGDGVSGMVIAPVIRDKKDKIIDGNEIIGSVPVNDLFDLTPYFLAASNNGAYFVGNQNFHNYSPPGGICWVQGDLTLKGDVTGCFIATGDIRVNGGFNHTPVANYPAVVSQNGNINLYNSSVRGLVWAKSGTIYLGGNMSVYGSAISAGDLTMSGCASVYQNSTPVPPSGGSTPVDNVGISGWDQ